MNRDDATVVITGSQEAQQKAKEMIEELINPSLNNNQRGGNRGHGSSAGNFGKSDETPFEWKPAPLIDWEAVNREHVMLLFLYYLVRIL